MSMRTSFFKTVLYIVLFFSLLLPLSAQELYWESPVPLGSSAGRFPAAAENEGVSVVVWQEVQETGGNKGEIWLSACVSVDGSALQWVMRPRFAGPFPYTGKVPNLFSVAVGRKGRICVCALSSSKSISVFTSDNLGQNFVETQFEQSGPSVVAPRVFSTVSGDFMLFAAQGNEQNFSLKFALSADGKAWSELQAFAPSKNLPNSFVPHFSSVSGKREMIVFQSTYTANNRITYQLYSSYTDNGGFRWSEPVLVTADSSSDVPLSGYTNQRPFLYVFDGKTYLIWERSKPLSDKSVIVLAELTKEGRISGKIQQLSPDNVASHQPVLFSYRNELFALWGDTRRGVEKIYLARQNGMLWEESPISLNGVSSAFGCPLVTDKGRELHIFWEQKMPRGYRVARLSADHSVLPPSLTPLSFKNAERAPGEKISAHISVPEDSSGIAGYSWLMSKDPKEEPPEQIMNFLLHPNVVALAGEDGLWSLKVKIADNAGNWSKSALLTYYRDTTPPEAPQITAPDLDDKGYVKSNSFHIDWTAADDDDVIAGYTYSLQYIASLQDYRKRPKSYTESALGAYSEKLPSKIMSVYPRADWKNHENGVYLFSVAAVDTAGNIGKVSRIPVYLNKYIPFTAITAAYTQTDSYGRVALDILGKGFTAGGTITAVYLDQDGKAPYDKVFDLNAGDFKVVSDRKIEDIQFFDLDSGTYRILLRHPQRGLYVSEPLVTITQTGTVKTGNYTYRFIPAWKEYISFYRYTVQMSDIVLWTIFVFILAGLFFTLRGLLALLKDTLLVGREVRLLITGDVMSTEQKQKAIELKQRGISLKYKMMYFISILVLLIAAAVSIPLGFVFVRTQETTLAKGLEERVAVLMESFSSGVKNYMPGQNVLELGLLLNQIQSMKEIRYATILGLPADGTNTNVNYVWASNDPDIEKKIDSSTLTLGSSRFTDAGVLPILQKIAELNAEAEDQVTVITNDIASLTAEGIALALKTDPVSIARRTDIQTASATLTQTLTDKLSKLSDKGAGSMPRFNNIRLDTDVSDYLFYKPVLYRKGTERVYVRSVVLMRISTEQLIESMRKATFTVIFTAAIITFIAIVMGIAGSLVLATVIINPIRRIAFHVAMIRDTGDKTVLAQKELEVLTRDEIGLLGENVNDMTRALVEAAINENMLLGGKEVQRAFLPLDEVVVDGKKIKQSVGHLDTENAQFFGYYEGAKGVSGDYFDFRKLDDRHYAVIKVDVSGKGSPAALIMAEVAALFTEYFNDWNFQKNGTNLAPLVYKINDHLVNRNLFGKFAAFTLAVFDSVAGDFYFCNAGDNLIHVYDASSKQKKTIVLPSTPTAGVFSSDLVEMKGGYPIEKLHVNKGDVLFLYTDGIEEAKRLYRDKNGKTLRFRDGTNIAVSKEQEAGYGEYLKLTSLSRDLRSSTHYTDFEKTLSADLKEFLLKKARLIADPHLYADFCKKPQKAASEYVRLFPQEKKYRAHIISSVKRFIDLTCPEKMLSFIGKMDNALYDYIMYMHTRGASVVDGEEMSAERVNAVIEAVFKKGIYSLVKKSDPETYQDYGFDFDFSNCESSPEDAVMALVAVEKVFRLYKDPLAGSYDHASVDKKVDAFLKKHFKQYPVYCAHQSEHPQPALRTEYMIYTDVKEDEQFDDLTLVAIKKK